MPKLYEYLGVLVFFYSNEHEPIHVHGRHERREMRAELVVDEGEVVEIRFGPVRGREPLRPRERRHFETLVRARAADIVDKWIQHFVLHTPFKAEVITKRLT